MSAESTDTDPDMSLGPGACRNAGQYALKRLEQAEETLRPVQIAEEYECTPGHMRAALSELRKNGQVERVDTGEYTLADGESASAETGLVVFGEDAGVGGEPAEESAEDDESGGDGDGAEGIGIDRPSVGGLPQLQATGGTDGSPEDDTMVSEQELQEQRRHLGSGTADDRGDEDDEDEIVVEIEDSDDDPDTGSGGAMPSIPAEAVVIAAIVGVGVWWFLIRPSSSDSSTQQQEQQQTDPFGGTGLIGA